MKRYHDYPKALEEYTVQRLRAIYARRREALSNVTTPAQARRYVQAARKALHRAFGPLPKKTPLRARTVTRSQQEGFTIENVLFESRPRFKVSANFYLPAQVEGKIPGVVLTCGHSNNGKAYEVYAGACIRLVREGYAVLAYDPIGQGERDIYRPLGCSECPTRAQCCKCHNMVGKQLHACGDWFGAWRLWDGMRAVDYLVSRPEVDRRRLGVTGQSGGGTLSAYLWAMDRRLSMVGSSGWTTSYLLDLENSMPADDEQCPPGLIAAGLDKIDFFMARAGEPTLLLGQEQDIFDNRGLRQAYAELRRMHRLMGGKPAECRVVIDTLTHSFSETNQRAMVTFFNRVSGKPRPAPEQPIAVPPESVLAAAADLDVHQAGSRPMYRLIARQARAAAARKGGRVARAALPRTIRRTLSIRARIGIPHHRRLFQAKDYLDEWDRRVHRFVVESEPGVVCVLRHLSEQAEPFCMLPAKRVALYLPDVDSQSEYDTAVQEADGDDLWMLDARGLGEGLFEAGDAYAHYGHEYMFKAYGVMMNEPLLGRRVHDVLSAVRLLRSEGAGTVRLVGRRQGAVLALLAGALDDAVASVASLEAPDSFLALATAEFSLWPSVNFPRGVLSAFDLPDVRSALGRRLIKDTRTSA